MKKNKGFTLVELIIVIAILAIIMLIAIPNFSGIQQRMQVRADKSTAAQIGKAVRIWYTEYNSDPSFKNLVEATTGKIVDNAKAANSLPANLANTTEFVDKLPIGAAITVDGGTGAETGGTAMVHLCQVPELISYVDTTLVPKSLVQNSVKVDDQYYYVGITGTGTGEKIVVAIAGTTPPNLGNDLDQEDVLYNGEVATTIAKQVAYIEP